MHLVSNNKWDPRVFDHGIDEKWADKMDSDPLEEHYKDLPYDHFGNVDLGECSTLDYRYKNSARDSIPDGIESQSYDSFTMPVTSDVTLS